MFSSREARKALKKRELNKKEKSKAMSDNVRKRWSGEPKSVYINETEPPEESSQSKTCILFLYILFILGLDFVFNWSESYKPTDPDLVASLQRKISTLEIVNKG